MDKLKELPSGWQWVKLGDVCQIKGGKRLPRGTDFSQEKTDYPYIRVTDFFKGNIKTNNLKYIDEKTREKISRYIIHKENVYISIAGSIGLVGIIPDELHNSNLTENAARLIIENENILSRDFLLSFLSSDLGQEQIKLRTNIVGQPKLALTRIATIEIPLPPLPEQQLLAKLLTEKLALVEQAKQKIEAQVEAAEQLTAAYLREVFESDEAKGWKLVKLGDVCSFENGDRGENYPSKAVQTSTGIPFINAGHLTDFGIDFTKMNYIPKDRFDLLGSGKIRKNDILFCLRGSLGKFASVGDLSEGAIASSLIIIRPKECVLNEFVLAYLQSDLCIKMIDDFRNGAAQPNLSGENLKNFKIPLLSIEKQKELATYLSEKIAIVQQLKTTLLAQLENVNQIPSALLKQAFNGEL